MMSQEQLMPGGYFLSGQLGVLISPCSLVIFPPQIWLAETSQTMNEDKQHKYAKKLICPTTPGYLSWPMLGQKITQREMH